MPLNGVPLTIMPLNGEPLPFALLVHIAQALALAQHTMHLWSGYDVPMISSTNNAHHNIQYHYIRNAINAIMNLSEFKLTQNPKAFPLYRTGN